MTLRPLAYPALALLVGGLGGFFVGSTTQSAAQKSPSRGGGAQLTQLIAGAGSDDPVDYQRLAAVCLGASRAPGASAATAGAASSPDHERAQSMLAQVEESALVSGVWSRMAGFKAQTLLARLPQEQGKEFSERINEQIQSGALRAQTGAWLPGSPQ